MTQLPNLPFLPSASLPEAVWVTVSLVGTWISVVSWAKNYNPRVRLKNAIRSIASGVFLADGVASMFTAPASNPTWLSVLTPMVICFGVFSMALLSVIDEQAKESV